MSRAPEESAPEDFAEQVAPLRPGLLLHCYRMLGSSHDAEDAVQETLLRGWRGVDRFEGRSSLRTWLYTVATNVCLREIERRGRRLVPVDLGPAADPADGLARAAERDGLARPAARRRPHLGVRRPPRRSTSSVRPSSSPSSSRSSASRRCSGRCWCCATCSRSRRRRPPRS